MDDPSAAASFSSLAATLAAPASAVRAARASLRSESAPNFEVVPRSAPANFSVLMARWVVAAPLSSEIGKIARPTARVVHGRSKASEGGEYSPIPQVSGTVNISHRLFPPNQPNQPKPFLDPKYFQ